MKLRPKLEKLIENKQKTLYATIVGGFVVFIGSIIYFSSSQEEHKPTLIATSFQIPTEDTKPENVRLGLIENENDVFKDRFTALEKAVLELKEANSLLEIEKAQTTQETENLRNEISSLQEEMTRKSSAPQNSIHEENLIDEPVLSEDLKIWSSPEENKDRHVLFEIPAGTVVKCVITMGADCSVGVTQPAGIDLVQLRTLDNGKLPRSVRVALKGAVITGHAFGDIAKERVSVRIERLTLVEKNGSFIDTEVSACVAGEDGRVGVRGVVVDRSGQIIARAAMASFTQGLSQSIQATLNNQTIEKIAKVGPEQTILNVDTFRNAGLQGTSTAFDKLAEYYIKRAEQLQPVIQVAAGRVVDVVFLKTVKLGEKDLKKKLDHERTLKLKAARNE